MATTMNRPTVSVETLVQLQREREERALAEQFTFVRGEENGEVVVWCLSHKSKETYTIKRHSCSCNDFQFRLAPLGLDCCKHREALLIASRRGEVK